MPKFMIAQFSNGDRFAVPIEVIARDRAGWDASHHGKDFDEALKATQSLFGTNPGEAIEWATCDMNWSDLEPHAIPLPARTAKVDREDEWADCLKTVKTM